MEHINTLINNKKFKPIIRFGCVGGLNTIVDFGVFILLNSLFGVNYVVSQILSYSSGTLNSYFLNKFWKFPASYQSEILLYSDTILMHNELYFIFSNCNHYRSVNYITHYQCCVTYRKMKCLILQLEIINMKIYIKHMVSNRCKMVVREELKKLGLHFIFVEFGEIEVMENITGEKSDLLKIELQKSGLDLLDDNKTILIEGIKNTLSELIYTSDYLIKTEFNPASSALRRGYEAHVATPHILLPLSILK